MGLKTWKMKKKSIIQKIKRVLQRYFQMDFRFLQNIHIEDYECNVSFMIKLFRFFPSLSTLPTLSARGGEGKGKGKGKEKDSINNMDNSLNDINDSDKEKRRKFCTSFQTFLTPKKNKENQKENKRRIPLQSVVLDYTKIKEGDNRRLFHRKLAKELKIIPFREFKK